jgi:hypothetical protein
MRNSRIDTARRPTFRLLLDSATRVHRAIPERWHEREEEDEERGPIEEVAYEVLDSGTAALGRVVAMPEHVANHQES